MNVNFSVSCNHDCLYIPKPKKKKKKKKQKKKKKKKKATIRKKSRISCVYVTETEHFFEQKLCE